MNNCLPIILLLLTLSINLFGQAGRLNQIEVNESPKISLAEILGDWNPVDSMVAPKITFRQIGNSLVEIVGIKDGVGNYMFRIQRDSILVNGIAANWPPYDCTLKLLNSNLLEIGFYQFSYTGSTKIFFKKSFK